jgi:hypothetical protein
MGLVYVYVSLPMFIGYYRDSTIILGHDRRVWSGWSLVCGLFLCTEGLEGG